MRKNKETKRPCPFCAGETKVEHPIIEGVLWYKVYCPRCRKIWVTQKKNYVYSEEEEICGHI